MTALSWFFGKKKEDKPIPATVEAVEVGSDEDYTIIQANSSRMGIYPQVPASPYQPYTPLPYSVLPQRTHDPLPTANSAKTTVQNQLEGVPFVLSPTLEQESSKKYITGLEDLRRSVVQITADINDSVFDYDFKLEHNILREASAYNQDN